MIFPSLKIRHLRTVAWLGTGMGLLVALLGLWLLAERACEGDDDAPNRQYLPALRIFLVALFIFFSVGIWLYRRLQTQLMSLEIQRDAAWSVQLQSETRLRLLMRQIPGIIWTTDRSLRMSFGQSGRSPLLRDSANMRSGATVYEFCGTRDPAFPAVAGHLKALAGETARFELHWKGRTFQAQVEPLTDAAGRNVGCIGVAVDISERKESEHNLRASEERYRAIAEVSPAGIWQVTLEGKTIYANPSMITLLELDNAGELTGTTFHTFFTEASLQEIARAHELRLRGVSSMYEVELIGKRGRHANLLIAGAPLFDVAGRLNSIIGSLTDITERKQMERSLRESEQRYRAVFDTNPFPMYVFDRKTLAFLAVNEATVLHYGHSASEFGGLTLLDLRFPEDHDQVHAEAAESRPSAVHGQLARHRRKDGTAVDVELSTHDLVFGGRGARLVVAIDVTERQRLEAQLRQAQKMEAVGRLAGGVAHDFNNVLTVISGYTDLLARQLGPGHSALPDVEEVRHAADRATALTRQLLAFSRNNAVAPRVLDLNLLVVELERLLRRLIGENVELTTAPADRPAWVHADAGQLEQVIVNLVVNARDAMPAGGRVCVTVSHVDVAEDEAHLEPPLKPGRHVLLRVTDTGAGMAPEVRRHLFEPFFTTKEQGKGTGLGLFTVYGFVRRQEGRIEVASETGMGTGISIYLPCALPPAEVAPAAPAADTPKRGSETVLLVEDEPILRAMLLRVLQNTGYQVLQATNGEAALQLSEAHQGPIHLLVTDLVMPRLGGRELAERLSARRPSVKILYMSGYTDGPLGNPASGDQPFHFLQKPFLPDILANKVREVLGS
jgi:PAS domain S-box-containing protein